MRKVKYIQFIKDFVIRCEFDNGEIRDLDISGILNKNGKYFNRVFEKDVFVTAKIGEVGQIYWDGIAEMKTTNGEIIPVEYDICPDFAYLKSNPI